jgi:ketosteroid isomerase-like protein
MSEENLEVVRRALDANRSGSLDDTVEEAVALSDPDIEFRSRLTSVEGTTYRGLDGIRAYFADMADAWREWHNEPDTITEVSSAAVLVDTTFRATAKSGVDVSLHNAVVFVLSDGRIVGIHAYPSRQEALEAAGLSD